ncbi:MRN complex-interacting protein [Echeneis naucrates]|uniref:MRN complex-interacting protein n=1 Tax=Echeneis naucrates TaxID=173247 RepID=UPI0011133643|nr:MRN complex-interacting protein [Echeneis naucrates]
MVQEFHVLRCSSCESFQVQQVKKVNRWSCKVCGQKQSLLKEFGRGSGADCRRHVQRLNAMRGAMIEEHEHKILSPWKQVETVGEEQHDDQARHTQVSRWSKYLDAAKEEEQGVEPQEDYVLMDRQQLLGDKKAVRKRKSAETPSQSSCSTLTRKLVRPSTSNLSQPRKIGSSSPHMTQASPLCNGGVNPPNSCNAPASKWMKFLCSDGQVQEEDESSESGRSQPENMLSFDAVITKPRPLLTSSSLFQMEDEFNFNDDFLSCFEDQQLNS